MSINDGAQLFEVARLAREVARLAEEVMDINADSPYRAGPKLTGELRRRSMDLTRALAQLRKS